MFDVAQTVGKPMPAPQPPAVLLGADAGLWKPLAHLVDEHGYELRRSPELGEVQGWTDHRHRVVSVRPDIEGAQATAVLAHELAHIRADHEHRQISRAQRETEAESAAHVVLTAQGLDTSALAVPYIAGWSRGDPKVIAEAAETVHKVAARMLADIERFVDKAEPGASAPAVRRRRRSDLDRRTSTTAPAPRTGPAPSL
ncbi:M48 family metalloprotease [Pseudonocardia sp. MH-G8]|uniref:M48 family metalloprotease n=1 Tax=Pseudonocardia sp. MH-G8 TaxID=1854588 RepID=UPI0013041ED1|nr:M48 family metalloprotease [Pseudonocardia sp. MH-G8]